MDVAGSTQVSRSTIDKLREGHDYPPDRFGVIGAYGTPVANVLVNHTLGGAPATLANVVLTQLAVTRSPRKSG